MNKPHSRNTNPARLVTLLLCFLLLLAGCGNGGWKSHQEQYQYEIFPGLDWGLTPAETAKRLGYEEKDLTPYQPPPENPVEDDRILLTLPDKIEVGGYPASLVFSFYDLPKGEYQNYIGLFAVQAVFEDASFEDVFEGAKAKIFRYYKDQPLKREQTLLQNGDKLQIASLYYEAGEAANLDAVDNTKMEQVYKAIYADEKLNFEGIRPWHSQSTVSLLGVEGYQVTLSMQGFSAAVYNNLNRKNPHL